jgi:hypothetical protein
MNQILSKIRLLLGTNRPTISRYKALIGSLSEEEVNKLQRDLFDLAYHHWHELPCECKRFFHSLFVHYREAFLRV